MSSKRLTTELNKFKKQELKALAYICKLDISDYKTREDIRQRLVKLGTSCDMLKTIASGRMTLKQLRRLFRLRKDMLIDIATKANVIVGVKDTKMDIVRKISASKNGARIGAILGAAAGVIGNLMTMKTIKDQQDAHVKQYTFPEVKALQGAVNEYNKIYLDANGTKEKALELYHQKQKNISEITNWQDLTRQQKIQYLQRALEPQTEKYKRIIEESKTYDSNMLEQIAENQYNSKWVNNHFDKWLETYQNFQSDTSDPAITTLIDIKKNLIIKSKRNQKVFGSKSMGAVRGVLAVGLGSGLGAAVGSVIDRYRKPRTDINKLVRNARKTQKNKRKKKR